MGRSAGADHDGAGVVDVRGHHRARPRRGRRPGWRRRSRRGARGCGAARRRRRRGSCAARSARARPRPARSASAGWSASATSRPWNSRLSGTSASRSWSGPGAADRRASRAASSSSSATSAAPARGTASAVSRGSSAARRSNTPSSSATRPAAHPGPAVGHDLDEALGGQPGERLPDRGAADAEPLGQLDLAEPGAGGEVAAQDQLPHRADRPFGDVARVTRPPAADCVQRRTDGCHGQWLGR